MSGLSTVAIVVCASSMLCSIISNFVTDGSTKKILNLVLGAFIVCSMLAPVQNLVSGFSMDTYQTYESDFSESTVDEVYQEQVVAQTQSNLEQALVQILEQNNISVNTCKIILSLKDDNSIIISSISIYISQEYTPYVETIKSITKDNFNILPEVQTE